MYQSKFKTQFLYYFRIIYYIEDILSCDFYKHTNIEVNNCIYLLLTINCTKIKAKNHNVVNKHFFFFNEIQLHIN